MSVNKVILLGNVGKDPEVRYLDNNVPVAKFPMATSEVYFDSKTNQKREITEWHNVILWRGLAEVAAKWVKKGRQVYVEGKISTRSWEKDGVRQYTTEIIASNLQLLGRKEDGGDNSASNSNDTMVNNNNQPSNDVDLSSDESGKDELPF